MLCTSNKCSTSAIVKSFRRRFCQVHTRGRFLIKEDWLRENVDYCIAYIGYEVC